MAVTIKKASKKKPAQVTSKPEPRLRTQVTRESTTLEGDREEEILQDTSEPVEMPDKEFTQPVANVGFNCRMTKNLGDFNSLQVGVSVHLPCYVHEIHETFTHAQEFVENKLNEVLAEYEDITAED